MNPFLVALVVFVLAAPALLAWALAYPMTAAAPLIWWVKFHAEMRAWVNAQAGRPGIIYLQSRDGSIPFARLPSGQILSLKKLQRAKARAEKAK